MKSYSVTALALAAGVASALPATEAPAYYGDATTTTAAPSYACNPAHEYPNGASCISTAGTLSLVTPVASTTYACNPAHSYPNGATCISTAGSLTLVTPASSAVPTTTYACNPAHSYPNGATCISTAGSLTLVTPSASATPSGSNEQACYDAYNKCRVAPDANMSFCASEYAKCLGYNPFASNGTNTVTPVASVQPPVVTSPPPKGDEKACSDAYNKCRVAPDANFSYCASQYAACLGYNPFANNGTNTVTPKVGGSDVYVTQVVTKYTTYCPEPTTLTYQDKTYTITSATTLTITDCPCTITTPVKSLPPASTITAIVSTSQTVTTPVSMIPVSPSASGYPAPPQSQGPSQTVTAPSSTRTSATYTGAADKLNVGGALMLGALAVFAL